MKPIILLLICGGAYAQALSSFSCAPTTVGIGSATACTVTLTKPAPTAGFPVRIVRTGTGIAAPTSITIGWTSSKSTFQVTTTASTPAQVATIAAVAGTVQKTVALDIVAASSVVYTITSITCVPPALVPGQQTQCTGALSPPVPLAGSSARLVSSSPNLPVPASVSIPGNSASFAFKTTAAPGTPAVEHDTVTATVAASSRSVPITIDPNPKFQFRLSAAEIRSLADGAAVFPVILPSGWIGTLSVRGGGYAEIDSTKGASFHVGGNQNVDTAYINFASPSFGPILNNSSEITFALKSAHSFAERQALGPTFDGMHGVFEIYDATGSWAMFTIYTSDTGQLQFSFGALGYAGTYTVPAGTEDTIFGKGVTVRVKITWSMNTFSLWLNDRLVRTNTITLPKSFYWDATSAFTVGARSVRLQGGGFYSCDDVISDFSMR